MSTESQTFKQENQSKTTWLSRLIETAKKLVDSKYFQVDPKRAHEFLFLRDRSRSKSTADLQIPIGKQDWMPYAGEIMGGVSDRPISSYEVMLFPDEFEKPVYIPGGSYSVEHFLREAVPLSSPQPEFGGMTEVFKSGNCILDIASGEAVAAMQLAVKFPETTIIGTDVLYAQESKIYPKKNGLQLTRADWRDLAAIPSGSIDAILSVQGVTMWGLPKSTDPADESTADGLRIIQAINRVSKPGTIIRFDMNNEFLRQHIGSNWEISLRDDVFIAQRR